LYSIVSTYFGGNGTTTFALPNLNGYPGGAKAIPPSVPIGLGQGTGLSNYTLGQAVGAANVDLSAANYPLHSHTLNGATGNGTTRTASPGNNSYIAPHNTSATNLVDYAPASSSPNTTLAPQTISPTGTATPIPHNNQSPNLGMGFFICWDGVYPVRS